MSDSTQNLRGYSFPSPAFPPPYQYSTYTPAATPQPHHTNTTTPAPKISIAHPYARIYAKKGSKRRIWHHSFEKSLFNPHELSSMSAPHRRTIYIASLEAHIDRLHAQLLSIGLYTVPLQQLESFRGLHSKMAKSIVSGLQHDDSHAKLKLLELERANARLRQYLLDNGVVPRDGRRGSSDSTEPVSNLPTLLSCMPALSLEESNESSPVAGR